MRQILVTSNHRLSFIFVALLVAAACLTCAPREPRRPSVIFLLLDTTRADHLSAYGYDKPTTPNIDRIATSGALFERHYVQAERTQFSMSQIYSSRYFTKSYIAASNYHMKSALKAEPQSQTEIFTVMRNAGYKTGIISAHPAIAKKTFLLSERVDEMLSVDPKGTYPHAKFEDLEPVINSFLERNRDEQFFLYIHALDPHAPNDPPAPFDKFIPNKQLTTISWTGYPLTEVGAETTSTSKSSPAEIANIRGRYDGDLAYTDHYIGRLWKKLEEMGLRDDIVFVITSDHGEDLGDFGTLGHLHVEGDCMSHVPLIMTTPRGELGRGKRIKTFTEAVDILPSLVDYLKIKVGRRTRFDGQSFIPLMTGTATNPPRTSVVTLQAPRHDGKVSGYAVQNDKYRLVKGWQFGKYELPPRTPPDYIFDTPNQPVPRLYEFTDQGQTPIEYESNAGVIATLEKKYAALAPSRAEFVKTGYATDRPVYYTFDRQIIDRPFRDKVLEEANDGPKYWSDNMWLAAIGVDVRTNSFSEKVDPLPITVDLPEGRYAIHILASNEPGGPTKLPYSTFAFKGPGDSKFKTYSTRADGEPTQPIMVGTYNARGGTFHFEIDDVRGRHMALLTGVVFSPVGKGLSGVETELRQRLKSLGYIQ